MIQTKNKMIIDGVKTQVACFPEAGAHADGNDAQCWTAGWGQVSNDGENPLQLQERDRRTRARTPLIGLEAIKIENRCWWSVDLRKKSTFKALG